MRRVGWKAWLMSCGLVVAGVHASTARAEAPSVSITPPAVTGTSTGPVAAESQSDRDTRLARQYEAMFDEQSLTPAEGDGFEFAFVQMLVMLAIVSLLAYFLLGKLLPRMLRIDPLPRGNQRLLRIVDRLPLDPKRSLLVIQMGDEHFFIGATEQNISLLARLEAPEAPAANGQPSDDGPLLSRFRQIIQRSEDAP